MSYLVLARKWRPTNFDDVVGQSHITRTLQNAIIQKRIPHALLLIGSRGVGKTSCARILAKALNCTSGPEPTPTPCDQCDSCMSISQGVSLDVFEIDGASNNGVELVREIRESARYAPNQSRKKVYIIDEVHMLSVNAFNALLKTLEEPPTHVTFIFATTEPHKIPETIISRCQRFDFKRISEHDIIGALHRIATAENINIEEGALQLIAREAQGGMRDSLSLFDQMISFCGEVISESEVRKILGLTSREMLAELLRALTLQDAAQVLTLIHTQDESGADLKRLMNEMLTFFRDLMVIKVSAEPQKILTMPPSELSQMKQFADGYEVGQLHRYFQVIMKSADQVTRSPYPRLALEMLLLQLCHQGDTNSITELLNGIEKLERSLGEVTSSKKDFSQAQALFGRPAPPPIPEFLLRQSGNQIPLQQVSHDQHIYTDDSTASGMIETDLQNENGTSNQIDHAISRSVQLPEPTFQQEEEEMQVSSPSTVSILQDQSSQNKPGHMQLSAPLNPEVIYGDGINFYLYEQYEKVSQHFESIDPFFASELRQRSRLFKLSDRELTIALHQSVYELLQKYESMILEQMRSFMQINVVHYEPLMEGSELFKILSLKEHILIKTAHKEAQSLHALLQHPNIQQIQEKFGATFFLAKPIESDYRI